MPIWKSWLRKCGFWAFKDITERERRQTSHVPHILRQTFQTTHLYTHTCRNKCSPHFNTPTPSNQSSFLIVGAPIDPLSSRFTGETDRQIGRRGDPKVFDLSEKGFGQIITLSLPSPSSLILLCIKPTNGWTVWRDTFSNWVFCDTFPCANVVSGVIVGEGSWLCACHSLATGGRMLKRKWG